MLHYSQPIYVGLPTDIAVQMTPATNLEFPLNTALPPNEPGLQALVVDKIRGLMDAAKDPIVIVDGGMALSQTSYFLTFLTYSCRNTSKSPRE